MPSARQEIIRLLCDVNLFPVGYKDYSWNIANKIRTPLTTYLNNNNIIKDINNSIRPSLETISVYNYSDGSKQNYNGIIILYNYYDFH